MEERLSLKAVDDYSDDYASKVSATFFASRDRIIGAEIRSISTVPQVNLFVIRELLQAWKHEGQKLRSPYFDYGHPEVAEALNKFQNLLSNHISISKENFQPLLKKAVARTIYLVVDPYDFFSDILDRQGSGVIKTEELKNEIKYLRINRPPLEKLAQRLDERGIEQLTGNEAFGLLDQILEEVNFTPEDIDKYIVLFSSIAPLNLANLYESKIPEQPKPVATVSAAKPVVAPPPAAAKPQPTVTVQPEARKESRPTLFDDFQKIGRIKDSLTINQKFMFTKMLFSGDFELFTQAIDRLDSLDNLKQAMHYLQQNYPEWDRESEEYEEFIELVQKRFT